MSFELLDDLSLLTTLQKLTITELLDASQVSTRCQTLSQTAGRSRRKLALLYGDEDAAFLPQMSLFQSNFDLKNEDAEAVQLLPPPDPVSIDTSSSLYITKLNSSLSVDYLTRLFPNIQELIIALTTRPEDLASATSFLKAYSERLIILKIYANYRLVTMTELNTAKYIHQHDRLLYQINNSNMSNLKQLTLSIRAPFLRNIYCRYNLPILKQLESFYFHAPGASEGNGVQLLETLIRNCLQHPALESFHLGIFPARGWNLNAIQRLFIKFNQEERFADFLKALRVLNTRIYPRDRWILAYSHLLPRLTLLNLYISTGNINRRTLIRCFRQMPAIRDIRLALSIKHLEELLFREFILGLTEGDPLLVVPTVCFFSLTILPANDGRLRLFDNHDLAQLHPEQCFPALRGFNLSLPGEESLCMECAKLGDPSLTPRRCLVEMVKLLRGCVHFEAVKVHLRSGCVVISKEELMEFD